MKSMVMKSIYAGLGLIGSGKQTVEQMGRKLAKQVNLSEKDGEKIARQLKARSEKAIHAVQKTVEAEVNKVVSAFHHTPTKKKKAAPARAKKHGRAKHMAKTAAHH